MNRNMYQTNLSCQKSLRRTNPIVNASSVFARSSVDSNPMLSIFYKLPTQVFKVHDPKIVEPSMLNFPMNWDGNGLRMTENKNVVLERCLLYTSDAADD